MKPDPLSSLVDILDAIDRVERYIDGIALQRFLGDDILQDAVILRIAIVGEAISQLPDELKARHPEVPWRVIQDMRNKLIHEYGGVDRQMVWSVASDELPRLRDQIDEIIVELGG